MANTTHPTVTCESCGQPICRVPGCEASEKALARLLAKRHRADEDRRMRNGCRGDDPVDTYIDVLFGVAPGVIPSL